MTAATTAADSRQEGARPAPGRLPGRWVWPAAYTAAAVLLFFCYLRVSMTQAVTGDGSSSALQAWDMLHGNLLLKGWVTTDVTFWTTELPEYMLVEAIHGLNAADQHICAALTYTILVVLASLVAKGGKTGTEGLVRVLIGAGIMIAPSVGSGAFIDLLAPDHLGTAAPVLLTWLLIDRAPRRWWVPVLAGLILAWTLDGDQVALITGVVPLVVVGGMRAYQAIIQRREPITDSWFELSLVAAGLGAAVLSDITMKLVRHLGGFTETPLINTFSGVTSMPGHAWWTVQGVFSVYGADFFNLKLSVSTALVILHLAGVAMAVTAVIVCLRRFLSADLVDTLLTAGIVFNILLYMFSTAPVSIWATREIAGVLPLGAALAGRTLAGPVIKARLLPLLGAVGLGYLLALGHGLTRPEQPAEGQNLAGWLVAHHLSYGLSGYGFGPSTTFASGGAADLRQANWLPDRVTAGPEEWDTSWYDPAKHYANFVVAPVSPSSPDPFTEAQVIRIFGQPAHVYHYTSQFIIMTYDKNLLNEVGPAPENLLKAVDGITP
jgi:hypothetical protein